MKLGTLVRHVNGYKNPLRFFNFCHETGYFKVEKTGKTVPGFWKIFGQTTKQSKPFDETRSTSFVCSAKIVYVFHDLLKNLNSTKRVSFFQHCLEHQVITTAHAHKRGASYYIFPGAFKQNITEGASSKYLIEHK